MTFNVQLRYNMLNLAHPSLYAHVRPLVLVCVRAQQGDEVLYTCKHSTCMVAAVVSKFHHFSHSSTASTLTVTQRCCAHLATTEQFTSSHSKKTSTPVAGAPQSKWRKSSTARSSTLVVVEAERKLFLFLSYLN